MPDPAPRPSVRDFPVSWPVPTRWSDNDSNGHLYNALYYALWDTALSAWLAAEAGVEHVTAPITPLVAESGCRYFAELAYPDELEAGIAVVRIGTTSVVLRLSLYAVGAGPDEPVAAAGHWVFVYVDRATGEVAPIPAEERRVYEEVLARQSGQVPQ